MSCNPKKISRFVTHGDRYSGKCLPPGRGGARRPGSPGPGGGLNRSPANAVGAILLLEVSGFEGLGGVLEGHHTPNGERSRVRKVAEGRKPGGWFALTTIGSRDDKAEKQRLPCSGRYAILTGTWTAGRNSEPAPEGDDHVRDAHRDR